VIVLTTAPRLDATGANPVDVLVWGQTSDTESQMATAQRAAKRLFGSSSTPGLVRIRNAFVAYPVDADPVTAARVKAAVKRLADG
jgi:hypothetical protein